LPPRSSTAAPPIFPGLPTLSLPAVGRFVGATVRHPLWWAGTAIDAVAVALHVLALNQGGGGVDRGPAVAAGAVGLALAGACVAVARSQTARGRSAGARFGVAAGIVYATTAALLKALTTIATEASPR